MKKKMRWFVSVFTLLVVLILVSFTRIEAQEEDIPTVSDTVQLDGASLYVVEFGGATCVVVSTGPSITKCFQRVGSIDISDPIPLDSEHVLVGVKVAIDYFPNVTCLAVIPISNDSPPSFDCVI